MGIGRCPDALIDALWADDSRGWFDGRRWRDSRVDQCPRAGQLVFVDASLVVASDRGQRRCETQIEPCCGRWRVFGKLDEPRDSWLGWRALAGHLQAIGWAV